jgi:hypothetical protein
MLIEEVFARLEMEEADKEDEEVKALVSIAKQDNLKDKIDGSISRQCLYNSHNACSVTWCGCNCHDDEAKQWGYMD